MPVGALGARVLGKELRAPAQDIGPENARYPFDDLRRSDVRGQERVVQVAVVIGDVVRSRDRRRLAVDGCAAVQKFQPGPPPRSGDLLGFVQGKRSGEAPAMEIGQVLGAQPEVQVLRAHPGPAWSEGITASTCAARARTVAPSISTVTSRSVPKVWFTRSSMRSTVSEVPPSSKKPRSRSTLGSPSMFCQISSIRRPVSGSPACPSPARAPGAPGGAGSLALSALLLAVRGMSSSST